MRLCACRLYSGCYVEADGNDYRGTASVTIEGKECAVWSDPKLDAAYFMRCLEETANIGDTKDLRLEEMVRTCISLVRDEAE